MWRVTAVLWNIIWCFTFLPIQVRTILTITIALIQFCTMFLKRLRLYRIERALIGSWTWYYIPFLAFIAFLNAFIVFFSGACLHAISAFNMWTYSMPYRRADICVSIVLGMTCYALESICWDHFFKCIRV